MSTMSNVKILVCCALLFDLSASGSREDVRTALQICKKGQDISDEEFEAFIKPTVPKTDYEKCLLACILKSYDIINQGKYDPDMALNAARDLLKEEPTSLKTIEHFINYTRHEVPLEEVDDECELATEIVHCFERYESLEEDSYDDHHVPTSDTYDSSGLQFSPTMLLSGGRIALRFIMNGVEQSVGQFFPGLKDLIAGWKNYGLSIINIATGDPTQPGSF